MLAKAQCAPALLQSFRVTQFSQRPGLRGISAEWQRRNDGTAWVDESGFLRTIVLQTRIASVSHVTLSLPGELNTARPTPPGTVEFTVVAETWDGWLNDINGFHVKSETCFMRSTLRMVA